MKNTHTGFRWLELWIAGGLLLAVELLLSSFSTYVVVSREIVIDHLRSDLASRAGMLDEQVQRLAVKNAGRLSALLQQTVGKSNQRIASILVENSDGKVVAMAGSGARPMFTNEEIRYRIQRRQPIFKAINTGAGKMLVEVFPFLLPPGAASPLAGSSAAGLPFATLEIAERWNDQDAPLWALKRHLLINSSSALMLLLSLSIIALRLRSYVAGRALEHEAETARSVQRDLLPPSNCELEDFDVAAEYLPVAQVGGDFYDAFPVRGDRAGFVLGDVSGKGLPAALLMGVLQGAIRSSSWTESPLEHQAATGQLNRLLYERTETARFASMFWSYFDSRSQHLQYINAGHCPPLLVKAARNSILRLSSGGPVLGSFAHSEFEPGSVRLDYGDVLVLYSDGIVEATNAQDEEFGEDRVVAVLREHGEETAVAIRDHILASLDAFTGATMAQDDRTLVVVVYSGAQHMKGSASPADLELSVCAA